MLSAIVLQIGGGRRAVARHHAIRFRLWSEGITPPLPTPSTAISAAVWLDDMMHCDNSGQPVKDLSDAC